MSFFPSRGLDGQGLEKLYRELGPGLLRWVARRVPDPEDAQDVWSETWARVAANAHRIRGGEGERVAYVLRIAANLVTDHHRRSVTRNATLTRLRLEPLRLGEPEWAAVLSDADGLLEHLDDTERDLVRMRVIEERDYDEIAATLAISEGAARQRLSRALRRLRASTSLHPLPPPVEAPTERQRRP